MTNPLLRVTQRSNVTLPPLLPTLLLFFAFAGDAVRYSLGWVGFFIAAAGLVAWSVKKYWSTRNSRSIPTAVAAFVAWCAFSAIWSAYAPLTLAASGIQVATALIGFLLASRYSWDTLAASLDWAFRSIIAFSLIIEAYAAFVVKGPISAFVDAVPGYYWVQGNLVNGLPIQGITGNRNLLAFVALLLAVTVIVRYASRKVRLSTMLVWAGLSVGAILLCDSATVYVAAIATILLTGLVYIMRAIRSRWHKYAYYGIGGLALGSLALVTVYSTGFLALLGRDSDLSGRSMIWEKVVFLAERHPVSGWGWISYWAPWVKPYKGLAVIDGTTYLQAHNALLDIWMQVGLIGVVFALAAGVVTLARAWRLSVSPSDAFTSRAAALLPLLLLAALFVQAITESRLLIEGNWLLFIVIACKVKTDAPSYGSMKPALHEAGRRVFMVEQERPGVWGAFYQHLTEFVGLKAAAPVVHPEVVHPNLQR